MTESRTNLLRKLLKALLWTSSLNKNLSNSDTSLLIDGTTKYTSGGRGVSSEKRLPARRLPGHFSRHVHRFPVRGGDSRGCRRGDAGDGAAVRAAVPTGAPALHHSWQDFRTYRRYRRQCSSVQGKQRDVVIICCHGETDSSITVTLTCAHFNHLLFYLQRQNFAFLEDASRKSLFFFKRFSA